jgi:hypothetical protein
MRHGLCQRHHPCHATAAAAAAAVHPSVEPNHRFEVVTPTHSAAAAPPSPTPPHPTPYSHPPAHNPSFVLQACSWATQVLDAGSRAGSPALPARQGAAAPADRQLDMNTRYQRPSFVQSTVAAHPKQQMMQDLVPECRLGWQEPAWIPGLQNQCRSDHIFNWIYNWINGISRNMCLDILLDIHG